MAAHGRGSRAETRRRVLDAAYAEFGERGIAASSLTDVAARAGLTKGAIYSSFAGKEELVLALLEERAMLRLSAALAGFTDAAERALALHEVGRILVEAMHADATAHRLLAEYYAMSSHDPDRRAGLRRRRREAREAVTRALAHLCETTGLVLPLPPEQVAVVLFALSNGLAVEADIDPDAVPDDLLGRLLTLLTSDDGSE